MARTLTIATPLINVRSSRVLTPAMRAIVLRIADAIDDLDHPRHGEPRVPGDVECGLWVTFRAADLRGGRKDNHWLCQVLDRLVGTVFGGRDGEDVWTCAMVAEWRLQDAGQSVRILVPPMAVHTFRAPKTFSKVEEHCLLALSGAARELYLFLAGKKRQDQAWCEVPLPELRGLLGVAERKGYERWDNLRARVLDPALARINDFGTVQVTMTPVRWGRRIASVRFDWRWKSLDEARDAAAEVDRPRIARGKPVDAPRDAPPLVEGASSRPASPAERRAVLERAGAAAFLKRDAGGS